MTLITVVQNNADGVRHKAGGSFATNADAATAQIITLGFLPTLFRLVNYTDRITYEWRSPMPAGTSVKTAADGVRTLNTADVAISVDVTPTGTGKVTLAAAALVASKLFYWEAQGE
jgi:hypothetical protein